MTTVLLALGPDLRFLTEYHLTQALAREKPPISGVFFSSARTQLEGYPSQWLIMYSASAWNLAAATDTLKKRTSSTMYKLNIERYPPLDLGSPFHYALGGYRLFIPLLKNRFANEIQDKHLEFFTVPVEHPFYRHLGLPESVA